ncbi:hypothetical protein, variant [Exophiala mesophila]|nr:hypothetical protein, variant [Exophiala mesophila]KIV94253.1 hypothetical protein, variant [Exophiala mesophila]
MQPLWQPESTRAGSQAAAVAHKDTAPVEVWKAPDSVHGHTAASSALQNQKSPPAITERNVSSDGRQKALLAATKSMSGGRKRAESAPLRPSPQSASSSNSSWALKAAESSQKGKPPGSHASTTASFDPARIQNMAKSNVNRQMYTSNPPVSIEVEERRRQDTLRASAVAMARKMYAIQQEQIDDARGIHRSESHFAAHTARRRAQSDAANKASVEQPLPRYENLEDAARKLAHERLAKIHDEHAEYRQYYGTNSPPKPSRFTSMRRPTRRQTRDDDSDSDEEQSRKIMQQMSLFQSKLAEVDSKKRQADRDALLAAAHKNVTARLNAMDEKVFSETGKTSPHQREIWERQARERAQRDSDNRLINVGKVHIGGGKYLDQSEIDEIAKARLQPTLDDITEKAEAQRARDEEIRQEQERVKAEAQAEKVRLALEKAEQKTVADKEKAELKAQKAEEKRIKQEQEHEERRLRTEQKATEKKARDEAAAAERERKRADKEDNKEATPTKSRLFSTFLGRGTATGAAGGAAAAVGGHTLGGHSPGHNDPFTDATEPTEAKVTSDNASDLAGDTVHDQVTMDPSEAAHAVAANELSEDEADSSRKQQPEKPTDDYDAAQTDGLTSPVVGLPTTDREEPTSPTSPASPSKRDSRVKSWFKKFKTGSKNENDIGEKPVLSAETENTPGSTAPLEDDEPAKPSSASERDVALAGRSDNETDDLYGAGDKSKNAPGQHSRSISPVSSSISEDPYVIAADVASSKYSADAPGSKRASGADQIAALSDSDDEPRGRKGFRERFLKKVIPGRDKDKPKGAATAEAAPTTAAVASINEQSVVEHPSPLSKQVGASSPEPAIDDASEVGHHANPEAGILVATEPLREKIQEPSTTSTEAGNTTATGATTPALTHTATNNDDDDFEEARDTFDEESLVRPPTKLVDVSNKAQSMKPELVDVTNPSGGTTALAKNRSSSPVGSKHSGSGAGSRFTEDL